MGTSQDLEHQASFGSGTEALAPTLFHPASDPVPQPLLVGPCWHGIDSLEALKPRYYFDVNDGEKSFVDDEGSDLPDANAARDEALAILPDYAQNVLPDGGNRASRVRDEEGNVIFEATFTLRSRWI